MDHHVNFHIRKHDFTRIRAHLNQERSAKNTNEQSPYSSRGMEEDRNQSRGIVQSPKKLFNRGYKKQIKPSQLAYQHYLISLMQHYDPRDQRIIIPYQMKGQKFSFSMQKKQLEQWLGDMHFAVTSCAFKHLIKKNLTFQEVKIFCSENILLNILIFIENVQITDAYQTMNHINNKIKDNLEYLMVKYPLTKQSKPNKKLRDAIIMINNIENDQNDILDKGKIVFEKKQSGDYTKEIMQFLNYIVSVTSSKFTYLGKQTTYFQAFNQIMEKIFQWVEIPVDTVTQDDIYQTLTEKNDDEIQEEEQTEKQDESRLSLRRSQSLGSVQLSDIDEMEGEIQMQQMHVQQQVKFQAPRMQQYSKNRQMPRKISSPKKNKMFRQYQFMNNDKIQADNAAQKQRKEYRQKVKKYTSYRIMQKINPNTELYTEQQLNNGNFSVKSTSLLRVMTKWIEELGKKIFKSKDFLMKRSFRFKSNKPDVFIKLDSIQKSKLYQTAQKYVSILKKFQIQMSKECIGIEANLSKRINQEKNVMKQLPTNQYIIGMFCTQLESAASTYLLNYLNKLIAVLLSIPQEASSQSNQNITKKKKVSCGSVNLITFKIGDLVRCKCSSHENQILRIFNLIKRISDNNPQLLKIVRIKDRLELGTKDILINLIFANKLLCEVQLGIIDAIQEKKKMYDSFSHYLYELHRSQLGPLMQCSCIWTHLDQRSKNFKKMANKPENICNMNYTRHQCKNPVLEPYKYSFVCSLCGVFYAFLPGILANLRCKICLSFYQCRNCRENKMSPKQLKKHLGLLDGHLQHFQHTFQKWLYNGTNQLPKYGYLIPKITEKMRYFFFQRLRFKETEYFLQVFEDQKNQLKIQILFEIKNNSKKQIEELQNKYFIFEWMQTRFVNQTLLLSEQKRKQLQRQKAKKLEQIRKKQQQAENVLAQITSKRKRKYKKQMDVLEKDTEYQQYLKKKEQKKKEKDQIKNKDKQQESVMHHAKDIFTRMLHMQIPKSKQDQQQSSPKTTRRETIARAPQKDVIFIDNFIKKSQFFNIRTSRIFKGNKTYVLFLNCYLDESQIRAYLKQSINQKIIKQLLENRNEVFSLQQQQLSNQLRFNNQTVQKYIKSLSTVSEIYFDENKIQNLQFIEYLPKLRILHCSYNSIVQTKSLKNLKYLSEINLSNNYIVDLQGIQNKNKLVFLNMSNNCIKKMRQFKGLSKLKMLCLSYNKIGKIFGLKDCTNLVDLDLSGNQISCIEELQSLTKLQILNLSINNIITIEGLESNICLKSLNLSYNQIEQIQNLNILTELTELNLYHNQISQLTKTAINNLRLEQLILGHNKIQNISNDLVLTGLKSLDLSHNRLQSIREDTYQEMKDLQVLDLSFNAISEIKYEIFKILKKLKEINLVGNPIKKTNKKNREIMKKIQDKHKTIKIKRF